MTMVNKCPQCGAEAEQNTPTPSCLYCDSILPGSRSVAAPPSPAVPPMLSHTQTRTQQAFYPLNWPIRSKVAAALLALFLGGLGIHKFYLDQVGMGIVYLLFSWTLIPAFIAFIEGIVILCQSDHDFQIKNRVRIS